MRKISLLLFQFSIKLLMYILVIFRNSSRRAKIMRSINGSSLSANSNLVIGKVPDENKNTVQAVSNTVDSGKFEGFCINSILYAYWGSKLFSFLFFRSSQIPDFLSLSQLTFFRLVYNFPLYIFIV